MARSCDVKKRKVTTGIQGDCGIGKQSKSFADGTLRLAAGCSLNTQESLQAEIKAGVGVQWVTMAIRET